MIQNEIKCLKALDHPNIVRYYESYDCDNLFYIIMEYCSGKSLQEIINQKSQKGQKWFTEKDVKAIAYQLLLALNHIHARNIVHRDVKPDNIMLTEDFQVKLIDFGLADNSVEKSQLNTVVGTPYYIAPEVMTGNYGNECDLWSLGITIFLMLSG